MNKIKPPITFRTYVRKGEDLSKYHPGVDDWFMNYLHKVDAALEVVRSGVVSEPRDAKALLEEAVAIGILRKVVYLDALEGRAYR